MRTIRFQNNGLGIQSTAIILMDHEGLIEGGLLIVGTNVGVTLFVASWVVWYGGRGGIVFIAMFSKRGRIERLEQQISEQELEIARAYEEISEIEQEPDDPQVDGIYDTTAEDIC